MRINLYSQIYGSDEWAFEASCDAAECFPDDPDSLAIAETDLRATGQHIVGGGAAPLFKLVSLNGEA